jgi:hypothetical protein
MRRFVWIRIALFLRQSRWGLALLAVWFAMGTILFHHFEHLSLSEAFLNAVYLRVQPGSLWILYSFWGQCVLFGIVISIFILQAMQRYNPEEGCRMLASEMKDHVIIVGRGHLGGHLVDHLRETARPYVLVEKNSMAVDDLIRAGEPVIVDDAKEESTLIEAGVDRARLIVITSNVIETALLVTKRSRERNKKATIIVRCYMDEFTEILESPGANEVISSSKSAFNEIATHLGAVPTPR